jgi:hypothetical protein
MCRTSDFRILTRRNFRDRDYSLAQCTACGQHICLPAPSPAEITGFYQGDYHSALRIPGGTEKAFGKKFERYRDWVLKFVRDGRSLDIGTATGFFPSLLKSSGFDAEGLEYNPASAAWGQKHFGVRIRTCDLPETSEAPERFAFISMTDVLEHTACPLDYLTMVRGYLSPGGFALVTFPDISSLESRYQRLLAHILRRPWVWSCCHIPLHVWEFTPATARAMFDKAGFDVVGFRRSQETDPDRPESLILRLLFLPLRILAIPPFGSIAGTQMEFMLRRRN